MVDGGAATPEARAVVRTERLLVVTRALGDLKAELARQSAAAPVRAGHRKSARLGVNVGGVLDTRQSHPCMADAIGSG